jgi:hypothetical protein
VNRIVLVLNHTRKLEGLSLERQACHFLAVERFISSTNRIILYYGSSELVGP